MTILGLDVSAFQPALPWAQFRAAGREFAIVRASWGALGDPRCEMHRLGALGAGLQVGFYHALLTGDGARQARTFAQMAGQDDSLMFGLPRFWVDVEVGSNMAATLSLFLSEWPRQRPHAIIGIYTGQGAWQMTIGDGHREFAHYPLWCGSWPKPDIWTTAAIQQNPVPGHLPGYAGNLDLDEITGAPMPTMPTVMVPRGSLVGIHAINPGDTLALVKQAVADGVPFSAVKMLNDAAALAQVKQASPTTWTYLRYFNPADDSLQGLDDWSETNEDAWCDRVLLKIYSQITAAQCLLVDWACAWNEEDPPGKWGYQKLGQTFLRLGAKNEARKAAGQTYVRLAFGCLAQGTPELWEIDQLVDTGLFKWMHDHFYSWDVHEGAFAWQQITEGYQSNMPSTPAIAALGPGHGDVPAIPGSGSGSFRFVWTFERRLRSLGQLVPLLIGEWYPGVAGQLDRYWWYDDKLSAYEYVTGFAPYNFGPTNDWPNLEPDYNADFRAHRINIRSRINGDRPMPITLAQKAAMHSAGAALLAQIDALVADDAPVWHVGDVALAVANPLQLYDANHNTSGKPRPDYASDINILAVSADGQWLKVFASPEYWVRAADVKHK